VITTRPERIKIRREYREWRFEPSFESWFAIELEKQKGRCYYCFRKIEVSPSNYQIDHKEPIYKGGSNDPANLCIACRDCNQYKSYHKLMQSSRARRHTRRLDQAEQMQAYMDAMLLLAIDLD
jgi:5-methylcytosine-specific restriction endonuclease McrA